LGEVSLCLVAGHESVGGEPTGIHTFTELRNLMQKTLGGTRDIQGTETQITQTVAFSAFSALRTKVLTLRPTLWRRTAPSRTQSCSLSASRTQSCSLSHAVHACLELELELKLDLFNLS